MLIVPPLAAAAQATAAVVPVVPNTQWPITQITDQYFSAVAGSPRVSGSNVVWHGHDGNDLEIFMYDGSTTQQLTNNDYMDTAPTVSGSNVVWHGDHNGQDREIFLYDGSTTTRITNNNTNDVEAEISGSNIVWRNSTGDRIFHYDGTTTTEISSGGGQDPQVDGSTAAWQNLDGADSDIFHRNLSTGVTTRITNNGYNDDLVVVSGSRLAWRGNVSIPDRRIFGYDGVSVREIATLNNNNPAIAISGSTVAWTDEDVFLYDFITDTTTQITNTPGLDAGSVQISGSNIVWHGFDGNDREIFLYDGQTITQITDNAVNDVRPQIDGSVIVWNVGDSIFVAVPEPTSLSLLAFAGFIVLKKKGRRRLFS
ncbi:MAG: PEP-CTERM sorting domain-containing protein [Phycisphaerales bacterium]|nr:PEP-CTERM sorting domain-containing protein [Phycisphaerales bacterium]